MIIYLFTISTQENCLKRKIIQKNLNIICLHPKYNAVEKQHQQMFKEHKQSECFATVNACQQSIFSLLGFLSLSACNDMFFPPYVVSVKPQIHCFTESTHIFNDQTSSSSDRHGPVPSAVPSTSDRKHMQLKWCQSWFPLIKSKYVLYIKK